ncbi:hypothetical protein HCN44_010571 [Aphidius gifuensis]|uniref:Odorant receptor n=1 Tax=Aphidius gifuensis TaxID=684658 RepID=A0A834XQV3_APHGI|nr:hypothetical protein HCN44_010571 [Aphidius gifuensis]
MLKYTILLLTIVGLWQPSDWFKGWKTYLYTIYTYLMILLLYTITFTEFLYLVTSTAEIEEIANNSFLLLSMIGVCVKAATVIINKCVIDDMNILLGKDPFRPQTIAEKRIQNKYNDIINKSTFIYMSMIEVTSFVMVFSISIKNIPNRVLSCNAWVPYDYTTSPISFWLTYVLQLTVHAYGASINAAFDTLIPSLMYQICCQFSILQHRFEKLPDVMSNIKKYDDEKSIILETMKLSECVEHHLQIYQWAERCNQIFSGIIFLQYSISSIILCVSVILLTQIEYNDPNFASTVLYLICIFFQIFILCCTGNQVTIESIHVKNAIYCMDWTQFELSTKKHLMMIMKRTMHPVVFTSGHFVKLSLDSFTNPSDWFKGWKTHLYTVYTILMILLLFTMTFTEFLYLITSTDEVEKIAINSFILLSMIGASGKAVTVAKNRCIIFDMIILLKKDPFRPQTIAEKRIQNKYNEMINKSTFIYISMIEVTMIIMIGLLSIENIPNRVLIYNAWIPYDYATPITFWSTYMLQLFAHAYGASINAAFDTLIPSMMFQICCQFSILQHRFEILPDVMSNIKKYNKKKSMLLETIKLCECVEHHLQIYQWAERCNYIFSGIIFLQYSISSIVLCVSVYLLTKIEFNSLNFAIIIMYLMCMLTQIFILCYSGSKVTIESTLISDAIYCMDWSQFDLSTKKNLMMVMKRALHPVKFTSGYFVTLSIESFTHLVKLSYSAFSVLKQSSG